jgi:hypothetical protein
VPLAARAETAATARILYLSSSSAYLDKGATDGLAEGAILTVLRQGEEIARLEVVYLAEHSAACRLLEPDVTLTTDDQVRYVPLPAPETTPPDTVDVKEEEPYRPKRYQRDPTLRRSEFHGRAGLEWKLYDDPECRTDENLIQPGLTLRLDGQQVAGRPIDFHVRLRSQYTQRGRRISDDFPRTDWTHRLYLLSIVYGDIRRPWRLEAGRLYAPAFSAAGNWDGGLLELRVGERWRLGLFGGAAPDLRDGSPDFDQGKVGGYLSLKSGRWGERRYRGTLGFFGHYTPCGISRELVAFNNEISLGRSLLVRQNLEVDINRHWRHDLAGERRTISRASLFAQFQPRRALRVSLGYDYYQNTRRMETRALPDSLFPQTWLQGVRLGANLRLSPALSLGGYFGVRDRECERKEPVFGSGSLQWHDPLGSAVTLQARYAYADTRFTRSHAPSLRLVRQFGRALRLGVGLGYQDYEGVDGEPFSSEGERWLVFGSYRISSHFDAQWQGSHTTGDVGAGSRALLRLGYRW